MARKQVERLRPSARLQAVARPVETYVRPAEQPAAKSGLGEFIRAIAPAAEDLAQIEKQKQLKLQREAEQGIASARAFDAKLGAGKALRAAYEDYADPNNTEAYLNMTPEQVRDKRAEIMQPFFQKVQDSGDEKLALAFQQDIELGNLDFFTKNYDPQKRELDLNNSLNEVFTEVLAIEDNPMLSNDLKDKAIDELLKTYQATSGTPFNIINEYALKVTANRVSQNGRNSLYRWLDKANQLDVPKYQDTVRVINTRLASYEAAQLKLGKDEFFSASVQSQLANFLKTGDVMSVGGKVTFKDNTTRDVSDEAIIQGMQALSSKLGFTKEEAIKQLYRPFNIVPTEDANAIMSGKSYLSTGDLTDDNLKLIANAYSSYKTVDGYEFTIKDALLDTNEKKLMKALDYFIEKRGVGPEGPAIGVVREAVEMVRTIDLKSPIRKASSAEIQASLDKGLADLSDFDEVRNGNDMIPYIQEGVDLYMQMGANLDDATKEAVADARKDFIVIESSNGTKHALPILNTAIDRTGKEAVTLQSYIDEEAKRPSTKEAIAARGGTGVVLRRTMNPKMFNVSVVDDNGRTVGSLGDIPLAVAADPATVKTMIAERIQRTLEDDKYVSGVMGTIDDAQFVGSPTITNYFGGTGKVGEAGTFEDFVKSPIVKDLRKAFSVDNVILQKIWSMRPTAEGIGREVDFLKEQLEKLKGTGQLRETVTPEAAAAKRAEQGTGVGEINLMNAFTDMFSDAGPEASEVIDKIASTLNPVSTAAATTIMKDEGFKYTPYDDRGKQAVGHGLQIESLEPDEKALIKDVNNIKPEESTAVVALKVQKTSDYFTDVVDGFKNLPESAQSGMIQMGYQLGRFNVTKKWPKFMESIKEAAQYAEGSVEQASALLEAKFHMLYNTAKDGTISATKWATQTADRAKKVAEEIIADAELPSIISEAAASQKAFPLPKSKPARGTVLDALDEKQPSSNIIAAPYKALFANTIGNMLGADFEFTSEDIGEDTLAVIKQATANAEARGSRSVEYGDYPLTKRGLPVSAVIANFKSIDGTRLSKAERKKMEEAVNAIYPNNPIGLAMFAYDLQTDPVLKAAGFVGGFSIQKDKSGKKFIKERWNFNNKSTSEGTIYKKMRAFFSNYAPITEDEGSQVIVELN